MTFERICELCRKAREIAKKFCIRVAAMFLKREGVSIEYAIASLIHKPI